MSDRQWVLGLENVLDKIPDAKEGRAIDVEEERRKHAERVYETARRGALERFRFTGEWDEARFGPRPTGSAA